ncbi:MAG TPA: hypothetical protein VNQ48_05320 [Microbacteriaceae bacterium]|nr:hypothetical protein [Microbacteriaceae bacterium]
MRALASLIGIVLLASAGCAAVPPPPPAQSIDPSFAPDRSDWPAPPRIPDDFSWAGRYVVPDLGVEVPFTWQGAGGDFQMVAGGAGEPIHFTNLIVDGELYTLTYTWPGIARMPCSHVGAFTVDELNTALAGASYAGRETLHREDGDHEVHHFRSVGVIDLPPELLDGPDGAPLRLPVMAGDVYTDVDDSTRLRQLLHFGVQNLYDPDLDEWILIDEHEDAAGVVTLPAECTAP